MARWLRIQADAMVLIRTIVVAAAVVGSVLSYEESDSEASCQS